MMDNMEWLKSDAEKEVKKARMNTRVVEKMEPKVDNLKFEDSVMLREREG